MKPRISFVTLGVDDLQRSLAFYRDGLGLPTPGIVGQEFEHGAAVFIPLEGGLVLALFGRKDLAHDTGIPLPAGGGSAMALANNVASEAEVDAVLEQARRAGGKVVKAGTATFWGGYAGYFRDPDGHLWEVAYNPKLLPPD